MKLRYFALAFILFTSCNPNQQPEKEAAVQAEPGTLKAVFSEDFVIGVAMNRSQIHEENASDDALIKEHFNAIVSENVMKGALIHPE